MTIEQENYTLISQLAKGLFEGEQDYFKFKAPGLLDLTIERTFEKIVNVTHFATVGGNLICDPDIALQFSNESKAVYPVEFTSDLSGRFHRITDDDLDLREEVSQYLKGWLERTIEKGYVLEESENDQSSNEEEDDLEL